jgi:H+-transporting ATPase
MAALASSEGGQDPVDNAIRAAAAPSPVFRPAEAGHVRALRLGDQDVRGDGAGRGGQRVRVVKGAFEAVVVLAQPLPDREQRSRRRSRRKGFRVLAVAAGPPGALKLVGLIASSDTPQGRIPRRSSPSCARWASAP